MAIPTDPGELVAEAKCFSCLGPAQREWVKLYLLQQIAGDTHTPEELMELAKCFACFTPAQLKVITVYLMTVAAEGAEANWSQSFEHWSYGQPY